MIIKFYPICLSCRERITMCVGKDRLIVFPRFCPMCGAEYQAESCKIVTDLPEHKLEGSDSNVHDL